MYMLTLQMITMQERNATPRRINGVFDYFFSVMEGVSEGNPLVIY